MENKNKPAYPLPDSKHYTNPESGRGLTKRELFAMAAMQGLLSGNHGARIGYSKDHLCTTSISIADELLKQLES